MTALSYKEFMEEVRQRLRNFSAEDFRNMILNWASEEHPSRRQEFLYKLTSPEKNQTVDEDTLLEEIEAFAQRVANGEYCDGWGWDDVIYEERDWGDESWAEEMEALMLQARKLLLQEEYSLAEEAYKKLFDILEMGEEPGHLPGDLDSTSMITVDMVEQVAHFLRALYMTSPSEERAGLLFEALHKYRYLARGIKLKDVINALDYDLPGLEGFLEEWIEFLKNQGQDQARTSAFFSISELLREAVYLKGGIPAIAEFARQQADKYPRAYLDWIEALEIQADTDSVLQVAREGLSRIPRDNKVRAKVAETISRTGEKSNDRELKLEGYRESYYSNPTLGYLLDLYSTAMECGCFAEIRDEAEQSIMELWPSKRVPVNQYFRSGELDRNIASEGLFANALLLGGRYEKVFEFCQGKGPLGWSSSDNPNPVFVTFMMVVLSRADVYSKMLSQQWEEAIRNTSYRANEDYIKKYQKIISAIKESIQLTGAQEEFYLKWCIDRIGSRIDAIVSNKHRKSYHKAAGLLVAMAETLANRGERQKGMALIERYRGKYPRHTAFKGEVTRAVQNSALFLQQG